MKTTALIERGDDGMFGIFTPDLKSTIVGEGKTVAEAKEDFVNSVNEVSAYFDETGNQSLKGMEFEYKFDVASFLHYYSNILSLAGLERLTGINQRQLQHYASGISRPRPEQEQRIEAALHHLGEELLAVEL